jgi:hypothetical protein
MRAADSALFQQDKIWSRYSNDKIDIAHTLTRVIRTLNRTLPLGRRLTALSVGSSNEPQFRILESAFQGGLYLLDIERAALDIVEERTKRQHTLHVRPILGDYRDLFGDAESTRRFRQERLDGRRMTLITLHHSLYYSRQSTWLEIVGNLYGNILAHASGGRPTAAIHAVLMASRSDDPATTTWLYNHFAGRFFQHYNDQDLPAFARELRSSPQFRDAQILSSTRRVEFYVHDFELFMAVVWMILLHPNVHAFVPDQQAEVIEHVYERHWLPQQPLVQMQNHLVIYRGKSSTGLI